MKIRHVLLVAGTLLGCAGTALASPSPTTVFGIEPVHVEYARWNRGHHYGWNHRHPSRIGYYRHHRTYGYGYRVHHVARHRPARIRIRF